MRHLTVQQISASLDGALAGVSLELVVRHLSGCSECRDRHARLSKQDDALRRLLAWEPDAAWHEDAAVRLERTLDAEVRGVPAPQQSQPPEWQLSVLPMATAGREPDERSEAGVRADENALASFENLIRELSTKPQDPAPMAAQAPAHAEVRAETKTEPKESAFPGASIEALLSSVPLQLREPPSLAPTPVPTPVPPPPPTPAPAAAPRLVLAPPLEPVAPPAVAAPRAPAPVDARPVPPAAVARRPVKPPVSAVPPVFAEPDSAAVSGPASPRRGLAPAARLAGVGAAVVVIAIAGWWLLLLLPPVIRVQLPALPAPRLPRIELVPAARTAPGQPLRESPPPVASVRVPAPAPAPEPAPAAAASVAGESMPEAAREPLAAATRHVSAPAAPSASEPTREPTLVVAEPRVEPAAAPAQAPARPAPARPAPVAAPARPAPVTAPVSMSAAAPGTAGTVVDDSASWPLLCGAVLDDSGAAVVGARVLLADLDMGARTDKRGHFCIAAPPGDRTLSVVAMGFAPYRQTVSLGSQTQELALRLKATP